MTAATTAAKRRGELGREAIRCLVDAIAVRQTSVHEISHIRDRGVSHVFQVARYGRHMATKTATPWGPATMLEQLTLPQRVGDKRFASLVELLESDRGERLIRFAYSTGGAARRGPVTMRVRDFERLRDGLVKTPALAEALGLGGDA
jgi:hypothetical protein